jgi:hypothetical protein
VIGSFLVNFFESSGNPKVQAELLNTLSKMLNFTPDQKAKVVWVISRSECSR